MMTVPVLMLAETTVTGHPKTKGSLEVVTKTYVREKPGSSRWRALVADSLRRSRREWEAQWNAENPDNPMTAGQPFPGRVGVLIVSYLQPPNSWINRMTEWFLGQFSSDVDKLARNVLDALVAV